MNWKIILVLIFISSAFFCRTVFAYDDKTTHPALTDEAIDFYNIHFDNKLTSEEKEWIVSGSILEDTPPRWVNHFYDPIYKIGWTGEQGGLNPQDILRQFTDLFLSNNSAVSALNWVHNQELQAKYKLYYGNQTWEKAIYEYVKNKNKKEAYSALGYVLHLLEDMAVPDHTRDDTHPNDSPYENYSTRFTRDTWQIADKLQNEKPIILNSLDEYFESLANYSNNYFFSKDTINDTRYNNPKIIEDDGIYAYGLDKNQNKFYLSGVNIFFEREGNQLKQIKNYIIEDKPAYYPILYAYFTRLSREAVLNGAGVIELFFKEAEKAEKDPTLLKIPPENKSAIISIVGEIFKINNFLKNTAVGVANTLGDTWNKLTGAEPAAIVAVKDIGYPSLLPQTKFGAEPQPATLVPPSVPSSNNPPPPNNPTPVKPGFTAPPPFVPSLPYPGFGGGGVAAEVAPPPSSSTPGDTTPPNPPVIISPADFSQIFNSANVIFSGTAEASSVISNDFNTSTTTADLSGNWTLSFSLNQSTTTIKFFARDTAVNISSSTQVSLFVDSISPGIDSFSILECSNSLATSTCLLTTTTLHLIWQSSADDLDYFKLTANGVVSTTTATSTEIIVADNSTNIFSIRAKDKTGNWSTSTTKSVEISSIPVVINEIAWAGTASNHSQDEWIELFNRTNYNINLNGWVLYSQTDNTPYIKLSKTILAKGYYLFERTDDNTVSDILADWKGPFGSETGMGLVNTGEILILSHASTTVDQTPSGSWPGGDSDIYRTMERFNPDLSGSDSLNWGTNNVLIRNGKNADSQPINGTPKARNSVNYLIAKGQPQISSNITLVENNSPYFVGSLYENITQVFQNNSTLTIEPGVVIKFYNDAGFSFVANSKIIAQGEAGDDKRIVFTSFFDDTYGGDLDATSTVPVAGTWNGVEIQTTNDNSIFNYNIFRYGGKGNRRANLSIKDISASVASSTFEYSKVYGLRLENSNSQISNNIFRNNGVFDPAGYDGALTIINGSPLVQSNVFQNNRRGIYILSPLAIINSNSFTSNSREAIFSANVPATFTNNSGSGNATDGIFLSGDISQVGATTTLKANPLAYVFDSALNIPINSSLIVESGINFKGGGGLGARLDVYGNFVTQGTNFGDIIFTSSATTPAPGNWWGIRVYGNSDIKGTTFKYADKAVAYYNSPIKLEKVRFENNNLAVYADPVPSSISTSMVEIENLGNLATTSPSGLW